MKKLFTYLSILLVAVAFASCSATKRMAKKEPLMIMPEKLNLAVNTNTDPYMVPVEYTVVVPRHYVTTRSQLRLVPYFTNGDDQLYLTPIYIDGKTFNKVQRRCARFKNPIVNYGDGIRVVSGRNPETITVKESVPFMMWMPNAQLKIATLVNVCKQETLLGTRTLAEGMYYMPPSLGPVVPPKPEVMMTKGNVECNIHFRINSHVIDPKLGDNAAQLNMLKTFFEKCEKDTSIKINVIDILGVASPDGVYTDNKVLSEQRAQALKAYLTQHMPELANLIKIDYVAEDWDGLYDLIQKSDLSGKDGLVMELKNAKTDAQRNVILYRSIHFPYIKEHFLPQLRRAACMVMYTKETVKW